MRYRKGLELRCFEYATRLVVHFRTPVLTTVVFLEKPGRKELAYSEVLDGRVVHERRFEVLRLWEVDPERALRLGPGAAALVGLAEKGSLPLLVRAARKIRRETKGVVRSDLLFILQALGQRRYTESDLAGVIPRETIMASSLWAEAMKEGRKEGAVAEARAFCIELMREHHPELADRLVPLIEACSKRERLHEWGLQATRLPGTEFLRLVTEQADSASRPVGHSRAPRPSRRAKAKRST